jgi:DNA polymerase III subunit delta'
LFNFSPPADIKNPAMSFKDFPGQQQGVQLLQRSLERGRLAHAYLFTGHHIDELEAIARTLAKALNCKQPVKAGDVAIDCCDACVNCKKVEESNHADVHWVRPESKSRVVTVDQMRELMQAMNLKTAEAEYKVAVIVGADRLNVQGANAFLKTLEEPPPKSVLILLSVEPSRILETILSRCLRLNFGGEGPRPLATAEMEWLAGFSEMAAAPQKSLLGRYRLMDVLLQKLSAMKTSIEETLTARSPLQRYDDVEKDLREKWEEELAAAIEAEYRRQRTDLLAIVQRWLRDVWLYTIAERGAQNAESESEPAMGLLNFPQVTGTRQVAQRIATRDALENLQVIEGTQRLLHTNVQEALALEVGLLKLHL